MTHQKKLYATLAFSAISAIILIVHGLFFDMDISQISRLTLNGFVVTFILVFFGLILMEKIFNLEEDEEIVRLKRKVRKIEKEEKILEKRIRRKR
jgi:L-lactate permease